MAEWFPAIRGYLAERGIRLPTPYPHPFRTLIGSALAALLAGGLLGGGYAVYVAVDAAVHAVQRTAQSLSASISDLLAEGPVETGEAPPAPAQSAVSAAPPPVPVDLHDAEPHIREAIAPNALPYKETPDAPLPDAVKQIDFALLQTLVREHLEEGRLYILGTEFRGEGEGRFPFQRLRFYPSQAEGDAVERFRKDLAASLDVWSERASLARTAPDTLEISVDGVPTHDIRVEPVGDEFLLPPPDAGPRLTIVMDDMGANPKAIHELLDLNVPVTVSIWPRSRYAAETARLAHAAGREVLIHQPMEPMQAPYIDAGPGAITLAMPPERIRRTLAENLKRVPYASGMNNHMGSRFTQDPAVSALVCDEAASAGLFILDSVTHPRTVLYDTARKRGLPAYRRAVFLDDGPRTVRSVLRELRATEALAHKNGQAVAIGHPHPETLAALRQWTAERDMSLHVVPLRHLSVHVDTLTPDPLPLSAR